jgi:biopolymer transport protein ExbB
MLLNIVMQVANGNLPQTVSGGSAEEMSLLQLFLKGGIILIPIVIISIIAIYIMFDRFFEIRKRAKINEAMIKNYKQHLMNSNLDAALNELQGRYESLPKILFHAVSKVGQPVKEIESSIELVSTVEINRMSKGMSYLGLIAGIAPMLGFIGTIAGVIKIFYNISLTDNISIGIISGGLYEKMISSGTGLSVGIIAFTGYHVLNGMIHKFMDRVEEESLEFFNIIQHKK